MEKPENLNPESKKKSFKHWIKATFALRHFIGIISGGMAGFLYYYFVGCTSGNCVIKSNPFYSILLGILLGYLIADLFKKKKQG